MYGTRLLYEYEYFLLKIILSLFIYGISVTRNSVWRYDERNPTDDDEESGRDVIVEHVNADLEKYLILERVKAVNERIFSSSKGSCASISILYVEQILVIVVSSL